MSRQFYCPLKYPSQQQIPSPKRTVKKTLPKISQKLIPLHNNSCQRFYKNSIKSELQLQKWAYVPIPHRKEEPNTKYLHSFDQFGSNRSRISEIPEGEESGHPSFMLLDKYFKRKQASKLREIIKIPVRSKEEGASSIGYQGINFHSNRFRRTLQGFYQGGRNASCKQVGTEGLASTFPTFEKGGVSTKKGVERPKNLVDFYFFDRQYSLVS